MALGGMNPASQASRTLALNMKLLAQHELDGHGGIGEGCNMQLTQNGRRILWLAHESTPKNFTGVDVSDPRNLKLVVQTELPHAEVRSNSLEVVGDMMVVCYQVRGGAGNPNDPNNLKQSAGRTPAGFDIFDVSTPEKPKLISHFDASGPHSLGAHCCWFVDGEFVHLSCGAPDHQPRNPKDHQIYRIVDVRNPSRPVEAGRWWYPGTKEGDAEPPVPRHPKFDGGYRPHNISVYENYPAKHAFRSEEIIFTSCFNAGIRVYDISNQYQPREVAYFVPGAPALSPKGAIQMNDVYVDDRNIVYAVDRFSGGLYTLEMNL